MPRSASPFTAQTLGFLRELSARNDREWFQANRDRYESRVRGPALAFIEAMAAPMAAISPNFVVSAKKVGGSLMRVHRDTRFSRDKTPYKTNVGIQFRHEAGKDVHAPGYYFHIGLDGCFVGVGLWRPDSSALAGIRARIDSEPDAWLIARDEPGFARQFRLEGESLKRIPAGYPKDHPLAEDLRRKDFIAMCDLDVEAVTAPGLVEATARRFATATPFMSFLCHGVGVRF